MEYETDEGEIADTATIDGGKFMFRGPESLQYVYQMQMNGAPDFYADVVLEKGDINVLLSEKSVVEGTPLNDSLQAAKYIAQREGWSSEAIIDFIVRNSNNLAGVAAFGWQHVLWSDAQLDRIFEKTGPEFAGNEQVKLYLKSRAI